MENLRDASEVLRECEQLRAALEEDWREHGRFEHMGTSTAALVIVTRDVPGKDGRLGPLLDEPRIIPFDPPAHVAALCPPQHYTELLARGMREMAPMMGGIGVIVCAEMWWLHMEAKEGEPPMTEEEARRRRAALPASLEHAPGRREGLMLFLEHEATGVRMWTAEITRNPDQLHPWKEAADHKLASRFKGIVGSSA